MVILVTDFVSRFDRLIDGFFGITDMIFLVTDTVSQLDRSTDVFFGITDIVFLMTDKVSRLSRLTELFCDTADIVILMTDTASWPPTPPPPTPLLQGRSQRGGSWENVPVREKRKKFVMIKKLKVRIDPPRQE